MVRRRIIAFLLVALFSIHQGFGRDQQTVEKQTSIQEITISLDHLCLDGQDIYVEIDGKEFTVQGLERTAAGWKARVHNLFPWCIGGHPACPLCESCHRPKCKFSIPTCVK